MMCTAEVAAQRLDLPIDKMVRRWLHPMFFIIRRSCIDPLEIFRTASHVSRETRQMMTFKYEPIVFKRLPELP